MSACVCGHQPQLIVIEQDAEANQRQRWQTAKATANARSQQRQRERAFVRRRQARQRQKPQESHEKSMKQREALRLALLPLIAWQALMPMLVVQLLWLRLREKAETQ